MDMADQLQKLKTLHEQGGLTDEEFSLAKKKLINDGPRADDNRSSSIPRKLSELHQLHRSEHDRWIGGVCGGLATATNIPSWSWRLLFVLLTLLHGLGAVMYILLWIFVPMKAEPAYQPVPAHPADPE